MSISDACDPRFHAPLSKENEEGQCRMQLTGQGRDGWKFLPPKPFT